MVSQVRNRGKHCCSSGVTGCVSGGSGGLKNIKDIERMQRLILIRAIRALRPAADDPCIQEHPKSGEGGYNRV
jgi:hypothetical protein